MCKYQVDGIDCGVLNVQANSGTQRPWCCQPFWRRIQLLHHHWLLFPLSYYGHSWRQIPSGGNHQWHCCHVCAVVLDARLQEHAPECSRSNRDCSCAWPVQLQRMALFVEGKPAVLCCAVLCCAVLWTMLRCGCSLLWRVNTLCCSVLT